MSKGVSGHFSGTAGAKAAEFHESRRIIPGKDGVVTGGNSQKLKGNLMEKMGLPRNTRASGYQAQHIIPHELANHPVLQKIGIDLDDSSNGIFLPASKANLSTLSKHRGYHKIYTDFVRSKLDEININLSSYELQRQVKNLQTKLRSLQENGIPLYIGYTQNDGKSRIYPNRNGNTVEMWKRRFNALS